MATEPQALTPADAIPRSWVDHAPATIQPYLRLARLDRPIGAWLLFWPSVFGLTLGAFETGHGLGSRRDVELLALFALGSIVMRGAGCTFNDIVDRDIDAKVARTRGRPIPSGAVSVKAASAFLVAQCLVGLAILVQLNPFSMALGAASLVLIAAYPFMKRVTWWPQAWLGLTFNWGVPLGFAAQTGRLSNAALLLYAGCFFWTLGYDTIYALQDMEDDALAGVKSTARLFGTRSPVWIAGFYSASFLLLAAAGCIAAPHWWFPALLVPALGHFAWQTHNVDITEPERALKLFRSNRDAGFLIAAAFVAASYLG